jgi:hypothetical protein
MAATAEILPLIQAASGSAAAVPLRLTAARLIGLDLLTPQIGYTYGYRHGRFTVWRTRDGGRVWRRDTVPGVPEAADASVPSPTVEFLGPQTGWIAWIVPHQKFSTLMVLRTTNAGWNWQPSSTRVSRVMSMVKQIDFVSRQIGWIRAFSMGAAMAGDTDIFRSTDRGASWTLMSASSGYIPNPQRTPQALPAFDASMPMTFANATDGWAAVGSFVAPIARAAVYRTDDAGTRWHPVALPVPHGYGSDATIALPPVVAGTAGTVLMQYQGRVNAVVTYGTHDGGAAWTVRSAIVLKASQSPLHASFISPSRGWIIDDAAGWFAATANGGRTWSPIRIRGVLRSASRHGYRVATLQMRSVTAGWILLQRVNPVTSAVQTQVLTTRDGGATWMTEVVTHGTMPS